MSYNDCAASFDYGKEGDTKRTITRSEDLRTLTDNKLVGEPPKLDNSTIIWDGTGNVLFCEPGVIIKNSTIRFNGNNGLVMLGKSKRHYLFDLSLHTNCTAIFGRNNYFNGALHAIVSEECSVVIGDDCLLSFGIWIRTADPHLIYDARTNRRINPSRDVIVGDHVWIGQNAMLLKGTTIGSGSIIGAMSVVAGKKVPSNCAFAGNPARIVREGVFWEGSCVHTWTRKKAQSFEEIDGSAFLFETDASSLAAAEPVGAEDDAEERLRVQLARSYDNAMHNRFAVAAFSTEAVEHVEDSSTGFGFRGRFKRGRKKS